MTDCASCSQLSFGAKKRKSNSKKRASKKGASKKGASKKRGSKKSGSKKRGSKKHKTHRKRKSNLKSRHFGGTQTPQTFSSYFGNPQPATLPDTWYFPRAYGQVQGPVVFKYPQQFSSSNPLGPLLP